MHKLRRLLSREGEEGSQIHHNLFLNFEDPEPTGAELHLYNEGQEILDQVHIILEDIKGYRGATEEIAEAYGTPNRETKGTAWKILLPLIVLQEKFYGFSEELANFLPKILKELVSGQATPIGNLENLQATVKQLAEIVNFASKFDEVKMVNPAIQNDLVYYRRALQLHDWTALPTEGIPVSFELATSMSYFYAEAHPMFKIVMETTIQWIKKQSKEKCQLTVDTLGILVNICQKILDTPGRYRRAETKSFVLRAMAGFLTLYNDVQVHGLKSVINVKASARYLKEHPIAGNEEVLKLLNRNGGNFIKKPPMTKSTINVSVLGPLKRERVGTRWYVADHE